ncbi:hypothetical protein YASMINEVIRUS_885 [Yasminevirus sp. GU-2018]|uniref:Uncharacterized protein n=1 Tax=Yasminevirus sp. GU-2018 TaxID=2420051 RepID=A0A5K0UA99_9VIRU|nr:hypothetical protein YASMINEVIRUS_885 [Yasminevirus sp. GU-2018]
MDILKLVILLTIISIMIGCCMLANIDRINGYFSETAVAQYDKYDVRKIDETDVKFINLFFPKVVVDVSSINGATSNKGSSQSKNQSKTKQGSSVTTPIARVKIDPRTGKAMTTPSVDTSGGTKSIDGTSTGTISTGATDQKNTYDPEKAMNTFRGTIPDELLVSNYSSNRTFGDELPWDREIGHCEVLKGTDNDLYKSVQDTKVLTFF